VPDADKWKAWFGKGTLDVDDDRDPYLPRPTMTEHFEALDTNQITGFISATSASHQSDLTGKRERIDIPTKVSSTPLTAVFQTDNRLLTFLDNLRIGRYTLVLTQVHDYWTIPILGTTCTLDITPNFGTHLLQIRIIEPQLLPINPNFWRWVELNMVISWWEDYSEQNLNTLGTWSEISLIKQTDEIDDTSFLYWTDGGVPILQYIDQFAYAGQYIPLNGLQDRPIDFNFQVAGDWHAISLLPEYGSKAIIIDYYDTPAIIIANIEANAFINHFIPNAVEAGGDPSLIQGLAFKERLSSIQQIWEIGMNTVEIGDILHYQGHEVVFTNVHAVHIYINVGQIPRMFCIKPTFGSNELLIVAHPTTPEFDFHVFNQVSIEHKIASSHPEEPEHDALFNLSSGSNAFAPFCGTYSMKNGDEFFNSTYSTLITLHNGVTTTLYVAGDTYPITFSFEDFSIGNLCITMTDDSLLTTVNNLWSFIESTCYVIHKTEAEQEAPAEEEHDPVTFDTQAGPDSRLYVTTKDLHEGDILHIGSGSYVRDLPLNASQISAQFSIEISPGTYCDVFLTFDSLTPKELLIFPYDSGFWSLMEDAYVVHNS
jgi:hypothetical protein